MRYMAHLSKDELLNRFFHTPGADIHSETAIRCFGLPSYQPNAKHEEEFKERYSVVDEMQHRYPSKRAGFGIITNIQGPGLLDQLRMFGCKGWDIDKCDHLIMEWLKVYKGVGNFLDQCKREVRQSGEVRDYWGMPRYLPGVWSDDPKTRAEAERAASSHKIQGGAQGMIQRSMAWLKGYVRGLRQAGEDVRWILQIHDEVILYFRNHLWDTMDPLVREGLTEHSLKLSVPVKCSGSHGKRWSDL
jgi:DNA polymerase I-like protein with 3'-5' exonuclease and polymerase domains